jgi:hypothetical protein
MKTAAHLAFKEFVNCSKGQFSPSLQNKLSITRKVLLGEFAKTLVPGKLLNMPGN